MGKLRVAMLGCGGIAGRHVRFCNEYEDAEIVALCDVGEEQVKAFVERCFPDVKTPPAAFTDPARMYAETKPDAVVICTPHTLHYEQSVQALDAGCHVLMEKPMVTSLQHAVDLERRVKAAGKVYCIAYNTPCSFRFKRLREIIREEVYGKLKVVCLQISQNWYQATIGKWRQNPALSGGGMIYDSGAHVMNSLVWSVESDVDTVHAFIDNLDSPVDINGTVNIRFANGVMACVAVAGEGPNGSAGHFVFTKGRVEIDPWSAGSMVEVPLKGDRVEPQPEGEDANAFSNFCDAIFGRAEPRTSPRHGVLQSQLMDAVYESARTGNAARPPVVG